MSGETVREWLTSQLTPLLPYGWRIAPSLPETLKSVTVVFTQKTITKLQQAPSGHLSNEILITVIDPHSDPVRAENALDDSVLELVTALDSLPGLTWSEARKVIVSDTYLGWDITTNVISRKEN